MGTVSNVPNSPPIRERCGRQRRGEEAGERRGFELGLREEDGAPVSARAASDGEASHEQA